MKFLKNIVMFFSKQEEIKIEPQPLKIAKQQDWPSVFIRCFSTQDGKQVMAYLRHYTLDKSLGAEADNNLLRYQEGRRSIVTQIMSLVSQGQDK